jgi:hypothetical protein
MRTRYRLLLTLLGGLIPAADAAAQYPVVYPQPVSAGSRYSMTLYGSDAGPLRPFRTHTWATFVRETPTPYGVVVEPVTISWLPADGRPRRLLPLLPQAGRVYSHTETLAYVTGQGQRVAAFGPYPIGPAQFDAAVAQQARLASGAVAYRPVDSFGRRPWLSHCVHAVTDPFLGGRRQPMTRIGRRGTAQVADQLVQAGVVGYP